MQSDYGSFIEVMCSLILTSVPFIPSQLVSYGKNRNDAIETMEKALDSYVIRGGSIYLVRCI